MIQIEGFNICLIESGEMYGEGGCQLQILDEPLVEFYDAKIDAPRYGRRGQFITRYHSTTLLGIDFRHGLALDGAVPAWNISPKGMRDLKRYLKGFMLELG